MLLWPTGVCGLVLYFYIHSVCFCTLIRYVNKQACHPQSKTMHRFSGFPPGFWTWLQGFSPTQPQEHQRGQPWCWARSRVHPSVQVSQDLTHQTKKVEKVVPSYGKINLRGHGCFKRSIRNRHIAVMLSFPDLSLMFGLFLWKTLLLLLQASKTSSNETIWEGKITLWLTCSSMHVHTEAISSHDG